MLRHLIPLLLLLPLPAAATHPLEVDDAGTLRAGERELELQCRPLGEERGMALSARRALGPRLDAGLAGARSESSGNGPVYEFLADLKWAPGHAHRWQPRPFLRPDFALLVEDGQGKLWVAGIGAGLSWEGRWGLLTTELGRTRPLDPMSAAAWTVGVGGVVPLFANWQFAAAWRREGVRTDGLDRGLAGLVRGFPAGDLSLGLDFGEASGPDLRVGWTTLFSD